jgi:hypothetical protein
MEKYFIEFMNIYFWVASIYLFLVLLNIKKELKIFDQNKTNAIKKGIYKKPQCFGMCFYILSIIVYFNLIK